MPSIPLSSRFIFLAVFVCILAGCATLDDLSISEDNLEGYLREQVHKFDREQLRRGSPLGVTLHDVDISVGPEGRDVAVLSLDSQVSLNAVLARVPVDVFLKLEGTPVYEPAERAIYIRRLRLLDSRIESTLFGFDMPDVANQAMAIFATILENRPVYRLDDSRWEAKLVDLANMDLKVAPGRLMFVPFEND